jgi:hypothetical protein
MTIVLIFLLEWIISPPPLYREVYSAFACIWSLSAFIGLGVAVTLRPAAGGRAATVTSFALFLLSLLCFAVPFIELYEPPHHLVNSFSVRGFIDIRTRSDTDATLVDCRDIRGRVFCGFGSYSCTSGGHSERWLIFHVWPITLVSAILPASWLSRLIRSRIRSSRAAELQSA